MWKKGILIFIGLCGVWFGYMVYYLVGKFVLWMVEWIQLVGLLGVGVVMVLGVVLFMVVCNIGGNLLVSRL